MTTKIHRGTPHWTRAQQHRLSALLRAQAQDPDNTWVGYWNSDQHGRPANNQGNGGSAATPGLVTTVTGPLILCTSHALHATRAPNVWLGCRVWIVALLGLRRHEENKAGALVREIVGEILPEECLDPKIFVRCYPNLSYSDLSYSDLRGSDLRGSNLRGSNLRGSDLGYSNLRGSDLSYSDLGGSDLGGSNLRGSDLRCSNLRGSNLGGSDLRGSNLFGAFFDKDLPGWKSENGRLVKA